MQLIARYLVPAALLVVGIVHLLPVLGVLGTERLNALYGITIADPNLEILMRHRALLFGLLGAFLIWAAFRPSLHTAALTAGTVSVAGFLLIALQAASRNEQIDRVFAIDVVALALLVVAAVGHLLLPHHR